MEAFGSDSELELVGENVEHVEASVLIPTSRSLSMFCVFSLGILCRYPRGTLGSRYPCLEVQENVVSCPIRVRFARVGFTETLTYGILGVPHFPASYHEIDPKIGIPTSQ